MNIRTLRTFSWIDVILISSCAIGALGFWPFALSHRPATVAVFRDNAKIAEYSLSEPRVATLRGKAGSITISIRDLGVRVLDADCPKHLCVQAGTIRRCGQQIVCAPNHIVIELESSSEKPIDAVTQ